MFLSSIKSTVSFLLFFFLLLTAEASCFLRHQLYRMQSSSFVDIFTFLKMEGWQLEELNSVTEGNSGVSFEKSVFTKNYDEKIAIYTSKSNGNIIHLRPSYSCFQTISSKEFGNLNHKFLVEQNKLIKEYQNANQILQLVEYVGGSQNSPEIMIFNEKLKNQVNFLISPPYEIKIEEKIDYHSNKEENKINAFQEELIVEEKPVVIFDVVETQPNPPGGMAGWNKYLSENLKYPTQARRMGIEGTVIVVFVINTDGSIQDVEVMRGIGGGCDEEVIRIVKGSPKWTPGMQRGKPVNTRMRLSIRFKLGGGNPSVDSTGVGLIPIPLPASLDEQDPTKESTEVFFDVLDTPPSPIGGLEAWQRYLSLNLTYPTSARMKGIQGTVLVSFIVNTDGTVDGVELVQGIGGGCDEEAIRIIKGSPRWTPGMMNGQAVRTRMRLPLSFRLS